MKECPVCDGLLWFNSEGIPSETWQWEATALLQKRDKEIEDVERQPYMLFLPVYLDAHGSPYIDRYKAYQFRGNRILDEGDVIELPSTKVPGETQLWEVLYNDRTYGRYYIRQMRSIPGPRREVQIARPSGEEYHSEMVLYDPAVWE
jgi:hypothetical protein